MLSNLFLQRILDEAADDEKKKKEQEEKTKEKETEEEDQEAEQSEEENPNDGEEDNNEDESETPEENPEESDGETSEGEESAAEDGEASAETEEGSEGVGEEDEAGTAGEDADGDFSLDGDDPEEEDLGPAPDGLPEADDDGSGDSGGEDPNGETNIQTNILKLSKLDRTLAKKTIGENLMSLRSTVKAALGIIDRNEAAIDPDVRDLSVDKLNTLSGELESFILHKFPILNYEDCLTQYLIFAKKVNDTVEYVRSDGIKGGKH